MQNKNDKLCWIEGYFYSGSNSKVTATCGEYKYLFNFCKNNHSKFIWITKEEGGRSTLKPREETFLHNNYIFNLSMMKEGIMNEIWY